jgi:DNA-binding transcriptional MerR regulator/copper chaperone CopZ
MSERGYSIGQAARAAGVGVETVRFYERKGFIERPPKPASGARRYPQTAVDRIRALRQGQELGFSLAEIDALLALHADPATDCADVRERAERHLDEIERKRARLGEVADKLRELIAACPGRGATHACAIVDAFTATDERAPKRGDGGSGQRIELRVDGMACGGCAGRVRALLHGASGVRETAVDLVSGVARVDIDPAATSVATLTHRLTQAGFDATER